MAATWLTYVLMPLAIGGAGQLQAEITPTAGAAITAVRAFVGPAVATSQDDANPLLVRADLTLKSGIMVASVWGAPKASEQYVTWFVAENGVWAAGPVTEHVNLSPTWDAAFPWAADWIVSRLNDALVNHPPFAGGKTLRVTRAYPRDTSAWPMMNVQVDSMSPAGEFVGQLRRVTGPTVSPASTVQKGRLWQASISLIGWCGTPEDRAVLARWLGGAMELICSMGGYEGWINPSFAMSESEDFETLGVPTFLVTASLTVTLESSLQSLVTTGYGHVLAH